MPLVRKMRQIGNSLHKHWNTRHFDMWQNAPRGFPAADRQGTEQRALTPAFHGGVSPHRGTTARRTIQKSCLHSVWLVCSVQDFAGLSHSFIRFSPSSALLSNGNCSFDMVCVLPHQDVGKVIRASQN